MTILPQLHHILLEGYLCALLDAGQPCSGVNGLPYAKPQELAILVISNLNCNEAHQFV